MRFIYSLVFNALIVSNMYGMFPWWKWISSNSHQKKSSIDELVEAANDKSPKPFGKKIFVCNATSKPAVVYSGFLEKRNMDPADKKRLTEAEWTEYEAAGFCEEETDLMDGCAVSKKEELTEAVFWNLSPHAAIFLANSKRRDRSVRAFKLNDLLNQRFVIIENNKGNGEKERKVQQEDMALIVVDDATDKLGLTLKALPISTVKTLLKIDKLPTFDKQQLDARSRDKAKAKISKYNMQRLLPGGRFSRPLSIKTDETAARSTLAEKTNILTPTNASQKKEIDPPRVGFTPSKSGIYDLMDSEFPRSFNHDDII